ncbi:hypothetical protein BC833DRAFT_596426 [Globomyces pollinis-pini]|nr:hypothetical protein BC833DRAFT_596426 [Globomyces pollinis-pini]
MKLKSSLEFIIPLPNKNINRLYILDSSFNPPTVAHLQMLNQINLNQNDQILLLLATKNVDKLNSNLLERIHLIKSLNLPFAIVNQPRFIEKASILNSFNVTFLMGYDTIIRFFDPKYYTNESFNDLFIQFFKNSRIHLIDRHSNPSIPIWDRPELKNVCRFKQFVDCSDSLPGEPISSTLARTILKDYWNSKDPNLLEKLKSIIPPSVLQLILKNEYYKVP